MPSWVIPGQLARSHRPGYAGEQRRPVATRDVEAWIESIGRLGVRSIICLLADDQLPLYAELSGDLVGHYRRAGFAVAHVPARDHQQPPLRDDDLDRIWAAYERLPKPVLVHCSAGVDRTGRAVDHILRRLGLAGRPSGEG